MSQITIYCKIRAIDKGLYTHIVVEDLNRNYDDDLKYITLVKLPNWESNKFEIDDIGFIQFQSVIGGETKYFDRITEEQSMYKYTNNYFLNFIKERDKCKQEKYKL